MKIVWYCSKCNWVSISDSNITHCMENCKCGDSGIDLEEHYMRTAFKAKGGKPVKLAVFDKGKWVRKR